MKVATVVGLSLLLLVSIACGFGEAGKAGKAGNGAVQRFCFACDLKDQPDLIAAYKKLHTPEGMWPEIPNGIKAAGVTDMEIYLVDTRMFLITEIPVGLNIDEVWEKMGQQARQDEWQAFVWEFQQALPDAAPGEKWRLMEKIFDLDDY